jgi:hypothetical protein
MFKKRMGERRVLESEPPHGSAERRHLAERRTRNDAEASYEEFEILMSAIGFRQSATAREPD